MKYFVYTLLVLAAALTILNITQIDYNSPFSSKSLVAVISTIAGLCVVVISLILIISKKIEKIHKGN